MNSFHENAHSDCLHGQQKRLGISRARQKRLTSIRGASGPPARLPPRAPAPLRLVGVECYTAVECRAEQSSLCCVCANTGARVHLLVTYAQFVSRVNLTGSRGDVRGSVFFLTTLTPQKQQRYRTKYRHNNTVQPFVLTSC